MTHAASTSKHTSALPLVKRLSPTPDPWEAFQRLASLPYTIFFDSAAREPIRGRYSYICASPFELLVSREGSIEVFQQADAGSLNGRYDRVLETTAQPLAFAKERFLPWRSPPVDSIPPFQAGAAGYFGYSLARQFEAIGQPKWNEFCVPDMVLGFYDWALAFDHETESCFIVAHGYPETRPSARRSLAESQIQAVSEALRSDKVALPPPVSGPIRSADELAPSWEISEIEGLRSNFSKTDYLSAVERAIEHIRAGDIFQVNLSQRLLFPAKWSPLEHYRRLRACNPAPFAGYFHAGDHVLASSSPEQFLSLDRGDVVTRPIKGTRPRGYAALDDAYQGAALFESEKDRSENVMIVALLRNDLSKVAEPGTVKVPRLFEIERHPTVYHLVSEVHATLRPDNGAFDLLAASFPGGSITGAPKVRAMEIIAELEPTNRGAYCGSLGWIGFDGGMNTSILIRTVTITGGWMQLPVGGGIVSLSRPEDEYRETLNKAAGMVRSLSSSDHT